MSDDNVKMTRWVATIAGLIGFLLSVATPLLPVVQTTATLNWPQSGQLNDVTAPLITQVPTDMTVTVPCDVIRSMPPNGGTVLSTAPKGGKEAALAALFVRVTPQRVDITDRNVVVASVARSRVVGAGTSPGCSRIEITSTDAGTFATFVGLTDPTTGKEQRTGFADPNLRPQIVGIFTDLVGPAPPGLSASATIDTRFSTKPTVLKLAADDRRDRGDDHRADCAVAPRPPRRQAHAQPDPGTLAHLQRRRRRRGGDVPAVACGRRELLRRRIHPRDGPGGRPRRLHVQLLPMVRQPRGPVRLVLQPACADDPCQRREHLDAPAGLDRRAGVLAAAVARGAPPVGSRCRSVEARTVGGGPCAPRGLDAVQQRPAARGPDRRRRADHLRADRAGHHLRPDDTRGAGRDRRRVHPRHSADRADRGCRSARGRSPTAADPCAQAPTSSAHGR